VAVAQSQLTRQRRRAALAFILPMMTVLAAVAGWPLLRTIYFSFTDANLDNIVIVTLPQPMIVGMLKGHGISFGNLTLDVSRASEFYPDIVMAGAAPLKVLHQALIVDAEARLCYEPAQGRRTPQPAHAAHHDQSHHKGKNRGQQDEPHS